MEPLCVCVCVSRFHLLPIKELHERPQHSVSICLCSVVVGRALDLVEDVSHLTHAAVNTSLKTGGRGDTLLQILQGWRRLLPGTYSNTLCTCVCKCERYLLANTVLKLSRTVLSFTCSSLRMSAASVSNCNTHTNEKRRKATTGYLKPTAATRLLKL